MISAREARKIIVESVIPGPVETCELSECHGRITAADVVAVLDLPPFDNASMDGFAVSAEDLRSASPESPVELMLAGILPAGDAGSNPLAPGHAVRIMTGAPVPAGATAVVEQEIVEARNGMVRISSPVSSGRNIRKRGEAMKSGQIAVPRGTRLTPAARGAVASLGISQVSVVRRPSVALLCTGNELVQPGKPLSEGQIWNSNSFSLAGALWDIGAEVADLGIARDDRPELESLLRRALSSDAVVISGGVSVGDYDLVLEVLRTLGVEIRFWKVNIKPGMPMAFGIKDNAGSQVPVFALPGNPVSALVTFRQFVKPGIERLSGLTQPDVPMLLKATLRENIVKADGKRHYVRGIARTERGNLVVSPTGSQSSGILDSLVRANCLIILPEDSRLVNAGESVEVELL